MTAAKKQLRTKIRTLLKSVPSSIIAKESEIVARKLFARSEYKRAHRVSLYLSMDKEVQTTGILKRLFDDEKIVYIPRCSPSTMDMLRLYSLDDFESLPRNAWNIPEPAIHDKSREIAYQTKECGGLDLIIMPGLCFNHEGIRLGHGKGYYDKYMAMVQEKCLLWNMKRPDTIALCLSSQFISDDIPFEEEYDVKPDLILRP